MMLGCDPVVYYDKIVENESSYDIWLIQNDSDTTLLQSNSEVIVHSELDISQTLNQYEDCPRYPETGDTIRTRINGVDTLNEFIITEGSNWQFIIEDSRGGSKSAECKIIITDSDLLN